MPSEVSENTFVFLAPEFKDKKIKICFLIAWYGEVFLIMEVQNVQTTSFCLCFFFVLCFYLFIFCWIGCYWLVCQLQFFTTVNSIQEKSELMTLNKLVAVAFFWLCILISRFVSHTHRNPVPCSRMIMQPDLFQELTRSCGQRTSQSEMASQTSQTVDRSLNDWLYIYCIDLLICSQTVYKWWNHFIVDKRGAK